MSRGTGQVVTFYSFKGGTGRTMALANIAWILAANGKRVLVADWDLEAPGLHRYFNPFLDSEILGAAGGITDLIREFEWAATNRNGRSGDWVTQHAQAARYAFSIDWAFPAAGRLDFLSAGRQNNHYAATLDTLDWDRFYGPIGGGQFLDCLRADMKRHYDYALIDSRSGLGDVADICTVHLPDQVVDCFTFNEQGIDGAARVAAAIRELHAERGIRVLPVPMRVDPAERAKVDAGRTVAMQRLAGLPAGMTEDERIRYWHQIEIPYRPYYAYEETLATFGDQPGAPGSLLAAYEALASVITHGEVSGLPPMRESERGRGVARFLRHPFPAEDEVALRYAPEDQVWTEWMAEVLASAGVRVSAAATGAVSGSSSARHLAVISHTNWRTERPIVLATCTTRPPLALYVDDLPPLPNRPASTSAFLAGQPAREATDRVLRLVGRRATDADLAVAERLARYPGDPPAVFRAPARNPAFTGRVAELRQIRAALRAQGSAVVLLSSAPVALLGTGGVGKSQVAIEYVHRFQGAYDIVWWIDADPVSLAEVSLADLAQRLGLGPQPSIRDAAAATLETLNRGEPVTRWLVVFDNAEDPDELAGFLPRGAGHVLITSRNRTWADTAQSITIDVFNRGETVRHLQLRTPSIHSDDADRIGAALGDLPLAIAAAGAWLAETGGEAHEYLAHIDAHGVHDAVASTWDLALERLRGRSPAAYRLLEVCSLLGSEIALDLVYSDQMAETLAPLDPTVTDRVMRARLVRQINRLALLKLDVETGQIRVHRLLQHVVRERIGDRDRPSRLHEAHLVLAAARPPGDVDDERDGLRYRMLWPHLAASSAVTCRDGAVRQLFVDQVRHLRLSDDLGRARDLADEVDRAWTGLAGDGQPHAGEGPDADRVLRRQLLQLRFNRAGVLRDLGRFAEALALDEEVVAEQRELIGDQHAHTLMTAGGEATDLRALGRYEEAQALDEATTAAWVENFGEAHPDTLRARHGLASSHRLMGHVRTALRIDEQVYELRKQVLGEAHPDTLAAASSLGRDLREAGRYGPSVVLLQTIARSFAGVSGPDHRQTHNANRNLAASLFSAGRAAEAAALLDRAYEGLTNGLGPTSPDTLACRLSRSGNLLILGMTERAASELRAVGRAYEAHLGATHPLALVCMHNRVAVARAERGGKEALALAARAAEGFDRALGAAHPYTLAARMTFAVCLVEAGEPDAAADAARPVVDELVRTLGPDHPDTIRGAADLLLIRRDPQPEPGRPQLDEDQVLEALVHHLGSGHPAVEALRERRHLDRIIDPHPY